MDRRTIFFVSSITICTVLAICFKIASHNEISAFIFFIPFYVIWVISAFLQFNKKFNAWWHSRPNFLREKVTSFVIKNLKSCFSSHSFEIRKNVVFGNDMQFVIMIDKKLSDVIWEQPKYINYADEIPKNERNKFKNSILDAVKIYLKFEEMKYDNDTGNN